MILGSTVTSRTNSFDEKLGSKVGSTWGTKQEQLPPFAVYTTTQQKTLEEEKNADVKLTQLAETAINMEAVGAAAEGE